MREKEANDDVKVVFMDVPNASFLAEFYFDDKMLLYKRGNTVSVDKFNITGGFDEAKSHFEKLFNTLLRYHKKDEIIQDSRSIVSKSPEVV